MRVGQESRPEQASAEIARNVGYQEQSAARQTANSPIGMDCEHKPLLASTVADM